MRDPRRGRNLALVVASVGAIAVLVAVWLTRLNRPGNVEVILGVIGLKVALVATVLAIVYHVRVVRRYDRMVRGEGVLARWRIEPERWRLCRAAAEALARSPQALPNELPLPPEIPAAGIEVIVAADAFCVGPEFEPLEKSAVVQLNGPVLEIQQRVPQTRYSTRLAVYRLPAAENMESEVARLAARFAQQATHSRTLVRKVALVALVGSLGALVWLVMWVLTAAKRG